MFQIFNFYKFSSSLNSMIKQNSFNRLNYYCWNVAVMIHCPSKKPSGVFLCILIALQFVVCSNGTDLVQLLLALNGSLLHTNPGTVQLISLFSGILVEFIGWKHHPVIGHLVIAHPLIGHLVILSSSHRPSCHPLIGHLVISHPLIGHLAILSSAILSSVLLSSAILSSCHPLIGHLVILSSAILSSSQQPSCHPLISHLVILSSAILTSSRRPSYHPLVSHLVILSSAILSS
jgi:hypothetical protein